MSGINPMHLSAARTGPKFDLHLCNVVTVHPPAAACVMSHCKQNTLSTLHVFGSSTQLQLQHREYVECLKET
eukprot:m.85942 g.85942  ORF g.85942 m.85942 type:complete len:72 (-) comp9648_c0_seq5:622-837(-)